MKIPFGVRISDSRMVAPTEVPNGEKCGCICPGCDVQLIARQGEVNEWHFAHARGADCATAVESALHKMAKQLIMERQQVYVPHRQLERKVTGPYDEENQAYCWQKTLTAKVQAEGLVNLSSCEEEQRVDTRRPDVLANIDGSTVAIEVAFTHFCDAEKLDWLKARKLTTLEIDIGIPPEIPLNEIRGALEERLFAIATYSEWLFHAGDHGAVQALDENEQLLLLQHAETDKVFETKADRKKADKARKNEFKAKIKDIDAENIRLTHELTLRIAYSEIRCTMRGYGYFLGLPDNVQQLIIDSASSFGGRYNKAYNVWEFSPPPDKVIFLYRELVADVKQRLAELYKPQKPTAPSTPKMAVQRKFRDEEEHELFEELAAIQEFDAGKSQDEAEQTAFVEILKRRVKLDQSYQ